MARLPSEIGRYTIKSLIGRGGMGDLYLAHDPNTNRLVALKLLNATLDSTDLRERFAREARALAALNHPNIVNIYDTGQFEGSPFIVMEYVRGETLAELIKRRAPVSISQKLKWISELCAGLAQAHDANIVHRDIKPANLMVDQQGRLKILDFGIARVTEENRTRVGLPLTQVNMMIGTPGYMSPEQIEGGEIDHRSDIFAAGAVCYELLSYSEAFGGSNTRQVERQVLRAKPAPLPSVVPGIDPEIDEIVQRALKRDPNKRYQDAASFERALDRIRARIGADEAAETLPRPTPPAPPANSGKAREARAEAAYQRALAAYEGKAPEVARRFAVEALAEDPGHASARAFLARLERRPSAAPTQAPGKPAPSVPTIAGTAIGSTMAGTAAGGTIVGTTAGKTSAVASAAPTVILPPGAVQKAVRPKPRAETRWDQRALARAYATWNAPARISYRWVALAAGVLIIAVVVALVIRFGFAPSGQLLTIVKPTGGTLTAAGVRCGTQGSDCSVTRPRGEAIELTPEPDAGFAFTGYTGDCAPGGRTIMSAARTCGATFTKAETAAPAVATQPLTIAPVPKGGTLEGVDILCGTKGSVCSANHPDGVLVELHPTADPGFTFMGFVGDCVPIGHTQMTGPRTCSATFSPTAEVSAPPPMKAPPAARESRPSASAAQSTSADAASTARGTPPPLPAVTLNPKPTINPAGVAPKAPVAAPQTDEDFAKARIQEALKNYCDAEEALDPVALQRVYPRINMDALKAQLNKSRYRSVQCKFGDPVFLSLDPAAGKATVQAPLKRVYEYTSLTEKPDTVELTATITLTRPGPRLAWQIDGATYKPK